MSNERGGRPTRKARFETAPGTVRDRLAAWVDALADEAFADALYAWAKSNEGPMPSREDARRDAEEQALVLLEGLGEWGSIDPTLLDVQQAEMGRASRRARQRNARMRGEQRPWWDSDEFY